MGRLLMLVVLVAVYATSVQAAKSSKKTPSKSELTPKLSSAIIAIQIVDPNENKTTKNFKRTIDQALGYGYQNAAPKYEVYKYSQHDIPPFQPPPGYNPFLKTKVDIQKSVEYKLPPVQPGTTLFSTINQNGQVGKLSSTLPQNSGIPGNIPVPVIILRVYPGQLSNPNVPLHPNLPQTHPFASNINQLDIQSLLSKYVSSLGQQNNHYQAQTPSKQYLPAQQYQQYQEPHQQYQYTQQYQAPAAEQSYQYYHMPQQYEEQYQDPGYYNQQYEQYYQPQYQQYQYQQYEDKEARPYSSSGLLTHENYPSEKHTNVLFKTKKGEIKKASTDPPPQQPVETKTIKIHLPENIADVQVQETYSYPNDQQYQDQPTYQQAVSGGYYYFQQRDIQQDPYQQESSSLSPYRIEVAKSEDSSVKNSSKNYHTRRRVKNKKRNSMKPRPVREENVE